MRIGMRLAASFAVVLGLLVIVGAVAIARLDALNRTFENTLSHDLLVVAVASDVESHARAGALDASGVFIQTDPKAVADALARVQESGRIIKAGIETLGRLADTADAKELEGRVKGHYQAYAASLERVQAALREGDRADAQKRFIAETISELDSFIMSLKLLSKHYVGSMDDAGAASAAEYRRARLIVLALIALAVLAGATLAWVITRGLTRQLGGEPEYAAEVANRIAAGDLVTRVETGAGDSASLLAAMKHMQESLSGVVERIGSTSDALRVVAREIAAGSADLSRRTEAQAARLEQTASSMEELTATVRQNAESATRGSDLASASAEIAVKSGGGMQQIVETMSSISESARRVSEISSVIDGIAFQTNILALNAAVEAARAGEHGRGFAVVAGEVRGLAQRSATAAKEIKDLIADSAGRIEAGAKLVEEAGATMQEMVASARRVEEINSQITAASREQAEGIAQVSRSVSQMEELMQQNAALVEQTGASLASLESQADALAAVIATMRRQGEFVAHDPSFRPAVLPILARSQTA